MMSPSLTNSPNRSVRHRARPAAGAASCPAGAAEESFEQILVGSRRKNASGRGPCPRAAAFFLQNRTVTDIRCGRFRPLPNAPHWFAAIAQLVEHVIRNDGVTGSNPVCGTNCIRSVRPIGDIDCSLCQTNLTWIASSAIPAGLASQVCPGMIGMALVKVPVLTISPAASCGLSGSSASNRTK